MGRLAAFPATVLAAQRFHCVRGMNLGLSAAMLFAYFVMTLCHVWPPSDLEATGISALR
jgi:hypothetical protein